MISLYYFIVFRTKCMSEGAFFFGQLIGLVEFIVWAVLIYNVLHARGFCS